MKLSVDTQADAAYVRLTDQPVAGTRELDENRTIDEDASGEPVGVEFLVISKGVDVHGLPDSDQIASLFGDHHIRVFA